MIKPYMKDNKKLYEVYVAERDLNKKLIARRRRGVSSEREAKEVEFQFKAELRDLAEERTKWSWQSWHDEFIRRIKLNCKNSTIANYDGYLKRWIPKDWATKPLEKITTEEVFEAIKATSVRLGNISQKNIMKMIRKIFQTAVDEGIIPRNPAKGIAIKVPQTMQKVLTAREVDKLLELAKETNHIFYPVWGFALQTGMRSGEMYALRWTDIDAEAGIISVNKQWTSKDGFHELKTDDWRVVPISSDLKSLLLEIKANNSVESEFVLPRLQAWTRGEQAKVLREFCLSAGITSVKFHDLRATFITNMLAQGVALVKVMAIVGHKQMETTDVYLRLAGVEIKGATESLGYTVPKEQEKYNVIAVNFGKK